MSSNAGSAESHVVTLQVIELAGLVARDLPYRIGALHFALLNEKGGQEMRVLGLVLQVAVAVLAPSAAAQVTQTYTYDALGRLTKVTPSSGTPVCYNHDPTDNRTTVTAAAGCSSSGGGNSPPQAVNDIYFKTTPGLTWSGALTVRSNDTDPDLPGDTLTIISVSGSSYASISAGGASITITAAPDGDYLLSYTIKDAANATSSATINLKVISLL